MFDLAVAALLEVEVEVDQKKEVEKESAQLEQVVVDQL
jgi:hypothetical protein|tara:strand:+ start:408 stop:521 length:114 start_codon:yes stop_codon:yes gene_type:complete